MGNVTWRWTVCVDEGVEVPGVGRLERGAILDAPAEDVAAISWALLRGEIVA